jgi:hypothetical protein
METIIMSFDQGHLSANTVNKRDQPSREQWMELKPTIWRLFIEEDGNLQDVVNLLRKQRFVLMYVFPTGSFLPSSSLVPRANSQ